MASQDTTLTLTTSQDLPPGVIAAYNRAGIQVRRVEPEREWWVCPSCETAWHGDNVLPLQHGIPEAAGWCSGVPVRVREVIDGG